MKRNGIAFGAPGIEPRWTSSAKDGVGTAYHSASCVWFTLSHGIINEIYFPHVDSPNTRDLQFDRRDDLGEPDRFNVYYGMADNRIGAARLDVPESLPPGALRRPPRTKV